MFPTLVKKFLYKQLYSNSQVSFSEVLMRAYLEIGGKIHMFQSTVAIFRAPSDISSVYGMCCEHIQAMSSWWNGPGRYDCVLVNSDPEIEGVQGFDIAHVFLFFSLQHGNKVYPCALIQWYSYVNFEPDEDTGLWKTTPDAYADGSPWLAVIHVNAIFRTVHLLSVFDTGELISRATTMHSCLDTFKTFYVNNFADHHSFANLTWEYNWEWESWHQIGNTIFK